MVTGTCRICGKAGNLSFEHVPPHAAFNERPIVRVSFGKAIEIDPSVAIKGPIQQGGAGAHTLCEECNSHTGAWYVPKFKNWCYQAGDVLLRAGDASLIVYEGQIHPLSVLKQIVTMFFSVNAVGFADVNPELVQFVLDKERKYLPANYRFFVYYATMPRFRYAGLSGLISLRDNLSVKSRCVLSEFNFWPLGYVMTIDSEPPDARLFEITHFARYAYNERRWLSFKMAVLPTYGPFPLDYRTEKEVSEQMARARDLERK